MTQIVENLPQNFTYIGKETNLQGTFNFKGDTKIAGKLSGEIRLKDEAPLCIEPNGKVDGTLYCGPLEVYGELSGEIRSTGTVVFYPSSQFEGHVTAKTLIVHPGANVFMDANTSGES